MKTDFGLLFEWPLKTGFTVYACEARAFGKDDDDDDDDDDDNDDDDNDDDDDDDEVDDKSLHYLLANNYL